VAKSLLDLQNRRYPTANELRLFKARHEVQVMLKMSSWQDAHRQDKDANPRDEAVGIWQIGMNPQLMLIYSFIKTSIAATL